jgi:hypothetical protein
VTDEKPNGDQGESVTALSQDTAGQADRSVNRPDGARLIREAFAAARASGRDDWDRMTIAVLKNRILALTQRSFDESAWGASSFREFVAQYPSVVEIDADLRPARVRLLAELDEGMSPLSPAMRAVGPGRRVRPDLWEATLDYSSGKTYVWDEGRAVPVSTETAAEAAQQPQLPTVSSEILSEWREEFTKGAEAAGASPTTLAALEAWRLQGLPDRTLPTPVRRRWNGELKRHIVERLESWFEQHALTPPHDLVSIDAPRQTADANDELRQLVIRCVRGMTREELEELRLPPVALLRIRP